MQITSACSFLFLFQWWLDQSHIVRRNGKFPDDQSFLIISCALSVVFCMILSTTLFGVIYLNLAIIPAYIGVLYAGFRSGVSLAIFFVLCTILFSEPSGISNLVLNTGVLLYPLLFGMAKPFKNGRTLSKIAILWGVLFPSMLFIVLAPKMHGHNLYDTPSKEMGVAVLYLFVSVVLGGSFIYFIETAWDRLEIQKQMKGISEKLERESERLQQITDVVPVSIMSLDDMGCVTELNEYMLNLFRQHDPLITKEAILGQRVERLFCKELDSQVLKRMADNVLHKQRYNEKLHYDSRTYDVFSAPLQQGLGGISGGRVVVVQDLTEEEKFRSELDHVERLTLVGQMAAGITHEIRNPMAVVRGFLQLMREKSPGEMDSYYQIIMEELDRANSIINDFLSLAQSRISNKETVQLHHIIEELSPLLWADANLRGQSVELRLCPSLPLLQLNSREIKQLILNLARNGMEAMEPKGVLYLETRIHEDRVELVIQDTGSGIPQSQLEKLFVPFYTTKSQGTGLGLPLCLSIAERHHGSITVDSQEGKGTAFIISFPYGQEASQEAAAAKETSYFPSSDIPPGQEQ
ncbi:nitrogen regulation protein NR(II) [Paenibacillus sp. P46E]|uniref:two-component system sensor histidine kinase NtrB n=1 Tax=Paenibacillus sp. P46E TaxID=1349436 RepID=UPI000A68DC15|nr:ATP-binding protein [Paenibacillus sp. P46E]